MWYAKDHVPIYTAKEWYNKIAKTYSKFHKLFNERDRGLYQRFLPRDLQGLSLLDLGAGDGRTADRFSTKWLARYVGFDIAGDLLRRAPGWIEKVVGDMEQPLPFEHDTFDIVLCIFSILYIESLEHVFYEVRRVCKVGGHFIVQLHIERRPYVHIGSDGEAFKMVTYNHSYTDLERAASAAGRTWDIVEVDDRHGWGRIYCFS